MTKPSMPTTFPVGARVLMDGRYPAIVKQAFPQGSSSYLFPHYKLDVIGGDRGVAVAITRVKGQWVKAEGGDA